MLMKAINKQDAEIHGTRVFKLKLVPNAQARPASIPVKYPKTPIAKKYKIRFFFIFIPL